MKCKVGDKVRFLNDVGGGKVTRIVKNTVYVLGDNDFEVPVLMSEVIVVSQEAESRYGEPSKSQVEVNKPQGDKASRAETKSLPDNSEGGEDDLAAINFLSKHEGDDEEGDMVGIFIAFLSKTPLNATESDQELYLINDSTYRVLYTLSSWDGSKVKPIRAGFLYPDSKEMVKTYSRQALNSELTFNIQCIFFKNTSFTAQQPEFYDMKVNPSKFYRAGSFTENDYFEERAIVFSVADTKKELLLKTLTSKEIDKVIEQKDLHPKKLGRKENVEMEEVDLHAHELVERPADYSPGQIIEMQLARFRVALEGGLKSNTRKMVFIHGVGNGKLKQELLKELNKSYPKLRYQDASFREYGYGATMVFLR